MELRLQTERIRLGPKEGALLLRAVGAQRHLNRMAVAAAAGAAAIATAANAGTRLRRQAKVYGRSFLTVLDAVRSSTVYEMHAGLAFHICVLSRAKHTGHIASRAGTELPRAFIKYDHVPYFEGDTDTFCRQAFDTSPRRALPYP